MPSVEKRGKTWSVRYVVKDDFGNIIGQKRKSGFATKADAMAAARDLERATAAGVDVHGDKMTCGEIMERWLLAKAGTVADTTLANYADSIERLRGQPVYNARVGAVRDGALKALVDGLQQEGVSASTAVSYARPLRFAMRWAYQKSLIPRNPFDGEKLQKYPRSKQVILSDADIADLCDVCKRKNPAFLTPLYLGLYGGLCREECAGLKWDAVSDKGVTVRAVITVTTRGKEVSKAPKTENRARFVVLPAFVLAYLHGLPRESEYVCTSRTGERYKPGSYCRTIKRVVQQLNSERVKAGKPLMPVPSFHDLRHTHVAMLIALGIQPKVIQERLGHSSITITMDTYGYLMPGMQDKAAEALDDAWGQVGKKTGKPGN